MNVCREARLALYWDSFRLGFSRQRYQACHVSVVEHHRVIHIASNHRAGIIRCAKITIRTAVIHEATGRCSNCRSQPPAEWGEVFARRMSPKARKPPRAQRPVRHERAVPSEGLSALSVIEHRRTTFTARRVVVVIASVAGDAFVFPFNIGHELCPANSLNCARDRCSSSLREHRRVSLFVDCGDDKLPSLVLKRHCLLDAVRVLDKTAVSLGENPGPEVSLPAILHICFHRNKLSRICLR